MKIVVELPDEAHARRAIRRGAYRMAVRALRDMGYPGAALALDAHAETLREPHEIADDGETTTVNPFAGVCL